MFCQVGERIGHFEKKNPMKCVLVESPGDYTECIMCVISVSL